MPLEMSDAAVPAEKPMDIPKELWMMVDHLYRNASQQVGSSTGNTRNSFALGFSFEDVADCGQW